MFYTILYYTMLCYDIPYHSIGRCRQEPRRRRVRARRGRPRGEGSLQHYIYSTLRYITLHYVT